MEQRVNQGSALGVFQSSRLFQITRLSSTCSQTKKIHTNKNNPNKENARTRTHKHTHTIIINNNEKHNNKTSTTKTTLTHSVWDVIFCLHHLVCDVFQACVCSCCF
jgi:hypothetical protein